jgi:hypothetical protein
MRTGIVTDGAGGAGSSCAMADGVSSMVVKTVRSNAREVMSNLSEKIIPGENVISLTT